MDIVCAIPVRPMKFVKLQVCKTSSFTNDQKAYRDFFPSAQWDVCPDFLCNKGNAVAVRFFRVPLDKTATLVLYYIYIYIPYRVDGMEYTRFARSESSRLVRDCRSVRGSDPGAAFPKQFFRGTLFVRTRVAFVCCA